MSDQAHVKITVTCDAGHIIGEWMDTIEEKHQFFCHRCGITGDGDKRAGKYKLTTEIVLPESSPAEVLEAIEDLIIQVGRLAGRQVNIKEMAEEAYADGQKDAAAELALWRASAPALEAAYAVCSRNERVNPLGLSKAVLAAVHDYGVKYGEADEAGRAAMHEKNRAILADLERLCAEHGVDLGPDPE
jgi:hypothetical protein